MVENTKIHTIQNSLIEENENIIHAGLELLNNLLLRPKL